MISLFPTQRLIAIVAIGFLGMNCSMIALGQVEPLQFSGRAHLGMSTSQIHGDQISGFNKFGASLGASVDIRRQPNQGVQWGILYTQKGSRRVPDTQNGDYNSWRYRFTYIDLPITKIWNPSAEWWVGAGIQPSILIAGEEDFYGTGYSELTYLELNSVDWGGMVHAGYQLSESAAFEVRLAQSLLPISDRPEQPVARWDNFMMNMSIQWLITWSFK